MMTIIPGTQPNQMVALQFAQHATGASSSLISDLQGRRAAIRVENSIRSDHWRESNTTLSPSSSDWAAVKSINAVKAAHCCRSFLPKLMLATKMLSLIVK